MRVLLLSAANNIHTIRWANGLVSKGIDVKVCSIHDIDSRNEKFTDKVSVNILKSKPPQGYFLAVKELKKIMLDFKPDILNAHYATGYGTLARLSGCQPYLLSVWGSDVYDFPRKSKIHRLFLKKNLQAAVAIASTSHCMAKEVLKTLETKHVFITPFGIDHKLFTSDRKSNRDESQIIIGTVKTLEEKYGIDILIKAFSLVREMLDNPKIKLEIVGRGSQLDSLKQLAINLNIQEQVDFKGFIEHSALPMHLNNFDIYAALSRLDSESFGVAILEASASGLPVVVSDADGLKEVVVNESTGFVVSKNSVKQAAEKLLLLIQDSKLRVSMGEAARKHVINNYTWDYSLDIMIQAYQDTIELYAKN
ncbi:glycosyltransferase [Psychrobacter sp. AOP29-E1-4]|uniref:glycosyltransferase n=1 Tax=Psychrobacter sp. AOP29-E1-4 TaxID=3457703 RepID=UPI004036852A